jgi:eukaryotic-like serine/threonine-protein kinase
MKAFREAHARSTALYERAPKNGQRLFDLAQAEYWIGFVAWQQGRFDEAGVWLTKYKDSGVKLAVMDRNNFAWQQEEAYGYHNLAVLDESRGQYAAAEQGMLRLYELYSSWIRQYPNDLQLRKDFADKISWLGSINMRQGQLKRAHDYFHELNMVYSYLLAKEPENAITKKLSLDAKQLLVDIQILLGQHNQARLLNQGATQIADEMLRKDSKNNTVRLALGVAQYQNARLLAQKKSNFYDEALSTLGIARQIEPENDSIAAWLATAILERGRMLLDEGRHNEALNEVNRAHELTTRFLAKSPSEYIRKCKASALILEGEIHKRMSNGRQADLAFTQARTLLEQNDGSGIPFGRLHALVWVMHLQGQQDQAIKYRKQLDKSGFVSTEPYP